MVFLHYKKTDTNQFFYETKATTPVEDLIKDLVEINNLRVVIDRLAVSIEDLATHGVLKPEVLRGLTTEETMKSAVETYSDDIKKWAEKPILKPGQRMNEDKTGYRLGVILGEDVTNVMIAETNKAKEYISKQQALLKKPLTREGLNQCLDNMRGALMIAYPGYYGLPDYEPARTILEKQFDFEGRQQDLFDWLNPKDTSLWWAGKELLRGKLLSDYSGKNEKTTIVIRMQKGNSGPPVREPTIDEETYKKMMSFYHKKQEESKKLQEDNDDNYMSAPWANPNNLKNTLNGPSKGVSWKPF